MGRYSKFKFVILIFVIEMAKLCLCTNSSRDCIERERQALLRFRESVEDPFHMLSSWEGNNCCQWKGVSCDAVKGHVVKLDLKFDLNIRSFPHDSSEGLILSFAMDDITQYMSPLSAREVDPSLQGLEYLNYLDLSGNYFDDSQIPAFFGSMTHLRYLNLSNAYFYGKVPHELGNLTKLQVLDLGGVAGLHIDDFSWVVQLSSLQHLDLSKVDLSKTRNLVKVLNMLPSLSKLILFRCGLSNIDFEIPDAFPNMTALRVLDLSWNSLSSIPPLFFELKSLVQFSVSETSIGFSDAIQNMTSLKFLDLSFNQISSVPWWVGKLSKLVHLDLAGNELGSVPDALQNLTSISFLELGYNKLNLVPSWIGNLKSLVHLDLDTNELQGPFPNAFQNLTSIRFLSVGHNRIASSVPRWLGSLKELVHLNLAYNKFTEIEGTLSTIMTNSCELKYLDLSSNNFQGEAFGGYNNLSRCKSYGLETIILAGNKFSGSLPTWLDHLKNLKHLTLDSNLFRGSIPPSLGELLNLRLLDLSDNHLDGIIPHSLGRLVNLEILRLSQNHLQGGIPPSLAQLVNLLVLDLSSNALKGVISETAAMFQRITNLYALDLSNNQISGLFPENIVNMIPQLKLLRLAGNLINGSIPHSLCRWETLEFLDISKNLLSGIIPDCWESMEIINLSSNKLSGNIPSSLGNLGGLKMLHLNNNSLHGEIPVSLKYCTFLEVLDLGENQLSGVIPSWIGGNFSFLQILILRKNMFFGRIPSNLCQLTGLQVLDLASNNLTGPIPHCFDNLKGMILEGKVTIGGGEADWDYEAAKQTLKGIEMNYTKNLRFMVNLDLSSNNLVGSIPNGLSALSGLHGLDLSHNHLLGEIPKNIGDMKSLESVDFAYNQLSGRIPKSMSALTFLSHLNLSYNNLSGMIPNDNQFQTLNDPSSYAGNPYLCGAPLPNECPTGIKDPKSRGYEDQDTDGREDKYEKVLFYLVVAIGFATGFWGVIGILLLKKSWRHSCFRFVENMADRMYVAAVVRIAKLKRWLQRNRTDE